MHMSIQVTRFRCRHPRCNGSTESYSLFTVQEHIAQHFSQDCSNKSLKNLHYAFECPVCRIGFVTKFYAVDHYMTKHHNVRQSFENYSQINKEHTDRYLMFSNVYMAAYLEAVKINKLVEMGSAPMPLQSSADYSYRPKSEPYKGVAAYGQVDKYDKDPYGSNPYGTDQYGNPNFADNSDDFRCGSRNTRSPVRSPAYRQPSSQAGYTPIRERNNSGMEQSSIGGEYSNTYMDVSNRLKSPDNKKTRGRGGPGGGRGNRREPMSVIDSNSRRDRNDWSGDPRRGGNKSFGKRSNTDNNSSFYGDSSFNGSFSSAQQGGFNSSKRADRSFSRSRSRSPPRKSSTGPGPSYLSESFNNNGNRGNKKSSPVRNDRRSFSRSVSRSPSRSPLSKHQSNPPSNMNSSYQADNNYKTSGGYKSSQNKRGFGQNRFGNNTSQRNNRAASFSRSPSRSPQRKGRTPPVRAGQFAPSPKATRSRSRSFSKSPER